MKSLKRHAKSRDTRKDALQEALIVVWQKLATLKDESRFCSFLTMVATNKLKHELDDEIPRGEICASEDEGDPMDQIATDRMNPEEILLAKESLAGSTPRSISSPRRRRKSSAGSCWSATRSRSWPRSTACSRAWWPRSTSWRARASPARSRSSRRRRSE